MSRQLTAFAFALGVCVLAICPCHAADEKQPGAGSATKSAVPAAAKSAEKAPSDTSPPEKMTLEKSLEQSVSFDYAGVPLKDVIDHIKVRCGVAIYLDNKALSDANIAQDVPISFGLSGIPLRSALRYMLENIGLTYIVDHDVLLITTEEVAKATILHARLRHSRLSGSGIEPRRPRRRRLPPSSGDQLPVSPRETWSMRTKAPAAFVWCPPRSRSWSPKRATYTRRIHFALSRSARLPTREHGRVIRVHAPLTRIYRLVPPASGGACDREPTPIAT